MGYNLTIGEAVIITDKDCGYIGIDAKNQTNDDAPAYDEPTDYTNMRWPSYSSWSKFLRIVELYELFFDEEDGLMREHPGEYLLNENHKTLIDEAMVNFKAKYPKAVASYESGLEEDGAMVRLEWLKYWVNWALKNCKNPIIKNT